MYCLGEQVYLDPVIGKQKSLLVSSDNLTTTIQIVYFVFVKILYIQYYKAVLGL
jgi:hypothetical protein